MFIKFVSRLRFSVISIFLCIQLVVAFQKEIEVVRFEPELPQLAEFSNKPKSANLLVIAADHGEGTTGLSHALGEHPCIIGVGEPFDTTQRWVSPDGDKALLRESGMPGNISTYSKLQEKIDQAMILKGQEPFNLSENLQFKHPNLLGFFETVQEEVCAHAELPALCGTRCVLLHKIFPAYLTYNYSYVDDYLKSPKTMVIQVLRDEDEVIRANTERFNMGKEAVAGLKSWNLFLNSKRPVLESSKVWKTIEMSGHIFRSPHAYFHEMKKMLRKFHVPTDTEALSGIRTRIEREFREYAARKARLLESQIGDQVEPVIAFYASAEIGANNISLSPGVNESDLARELATETEINEVNPAAELAIDTELEPNRSTSSNQIEPAPVSETETEVASSSSPQSTGINQTELANELPEETDLVASSMGQSVGASQMEPARAFESGVSIADFYASQHLLEE